MNEIRDHISIWQDIGFTVSLCQINFLALMKLSMTCEGDQFCDMKPGLTSAYIMCSNNFPFFFFLYLFYFMSDTFPVQYFYA